MGGGGSDYVFYGVGVGYFEYDHILQFYGTDYCMFDLKYYGIYTPTLASITPTPKSLRVAQTRSSFTSPTHTHKCIPHLTGLSLIGNYSITLNANYNNTHVYLDISVDADTQLNYIVVYVLVVDLYIGEVVNGHRVEYGGFEIRDGVALGDVSKYPCNTDATRYAMLIGLANMQFNNPNTSIRTTFNLKTQTNQTN